MSKRFTESKIWDDVWYQDLPLIWKIFWKYLCDKCDEAGIWKINKSLAEFQLKNKIKWEQAEHRLNNGKVRVDFYEDFWVIKDFVTFQYGEKVFTSPHAFHAKIRNMLDRVSHRVSNIGYPDTLQVKEKEEVKEKVKVSKGIIPPLFEDVSSYCQERNKGINPEKWFNHYQAKGWLIGKNKMIDWKAAVRTWETNESQKLKGGMEDVRKRLSAEKAGKI